MFNSFPKDILVTVVAATMLLLLLMISIVVLVLIYQRRKQQQKREMIKLKNTYNQELLKSRLEIQEETLRYISQEIHDNIGQVLSLVKLNLNLMESERPSESLVGTKQLVSKAIIDLRGLSKSLNPDRVNDLGLEESLRQELDVLEKTKVYTTRLKINGSVHKLPAEKQIIIFRIVQESISNIIRHAEADRVEILLDYQPTSFSITISDNGKGFDVETEQGSPARGIGLRNIQHRASLMGAESSIRSKEGQGSRVTIALPID